MLGTSAAFAASGAKHSGGSSLTLAKMNGISPQVRTGTLGELLVQTRLLQFGVQAAPPIKDSGNDLIGIKDEVFRAIQVKTRTTEPFALGDFPPFYHILALVRLVGEDETIYLDASSVYLIPEPVVKSRVIRTFDELDDFTIGSRWVSTLFARTEAGLTRRQSQRPRPSRLLLAQEPRRP